jgi:cadmium resistance protein CadD (predicted permease)
MDTVTMTTGDVQWVSKEVVKDTHMVNIRPMDILVSVLLEVMPTSIHTNTILNMDTVLPILLGLNMVTMEMDIIKITRNDENREHDTIATMKTENNQGMVTRRAENRLEAVSTVTMATLRADGHLEVTMVITRVEDHPKEVVTIATMMAESHL